METKQNELKYDVTQVIETPNEIRAVITNIVEKKAKEIFVTKNGEIKTEEPEQEFLSITVEGLNGEYVKDYPISKPKVITDNSQLGKFLLRYKQLDVGVSVLLMKNSKGHYDLMY